MNIFVDTGAFFAMANRRDKHHAQAKDYFLSNFESSKFITSNFVFVESWMLIHHKLGAPSSRKFWESIRSHVVTLLDVTMQDLELAWAINGQYSDQDFSIVDCTSFAMMERLDIEKAFTFDHHFLVYRSPERGFFQQAP